MSRIDDLLERSADEVRQAVAAMPEREVTTVAQTSTRKTYLSAAVAVAGVVVVVLLGWALFGFGPDEVDPIEPTPTPVDPDAAPLPAPPASLEAQTYATDVLGPTFSFSAGEGATVGWFLQVALPGEVAISHPLSNGPGDRDIWFGHPDALSDPEDPYAVGWPIGDLDGWLEANADWVVEGPTESIVGGRPATAFTLAGAPPCRDPEGDGELPCPAFVFDGDEHALWLVEGARYEIWWIEDVDGSPFVIAAGDSTWTDEFRADVDAVVASWAAGGGAAAPEADAEPEPAEVMPLPTVVGGADPVPLEAATYTTDVLGPDFSFAVDGDGVDDGWATTATAPGQVIIVRAPSGGALAVDTAIWFGHPTSMTDPAEPFQVDPDSVAWPMDDLEGWLAANADWVVDGPTETTVGGRSATQFTLEGFPACREAQPGALTDLGCPGLAYDGRVGVLMLFDGLTYEVWWVEDVGGSPFVIAASAPEWTDENRADVDAVVASWSSDMPPSSALDLEGDAELLAERARAAAAEVGDPALQAAIEDAIDFGLLDFSGPPEDAIFILLEFAWLLDTTNPEPEMLDLFVAADGGARTSFEESDTFGADGLIVVTGEGEYRVESAEASTVADYSPSIAATAPEDAVVVEVVVTIPEIEVRAADGSVIRTVPERVSQELAYVLVPGDVGWLIWSELA